MTHLVSRRSAAAVVLTLFSLSVTAPAQARAAQAFTGSRIELMVGFDSTELPYDDGKEVMYGIRAGYDAGRGKWRYGVEADWSRSNAHKVATNLFVPNDSLKVRYGNDLYVGGRGGRMLNDHVLMYGKGGLALTQLSAVYSGGKLPQGPRLTQDDFHTAKFERPGTLVGFWAGGGFEFAVSQKVFVTTEYRYSNFHDGLYRHQAITGLGLRF